MNDFGRINDAAAKSLIAIGKGSNNVEPALVNWIEQHQEKDFVRNGIDELWELVG